VHGISGATILGDGRVVVILDLLATDSRAAPLQLKCRSQQRRVWSAGKRWRAEIRVARGRETPLVMVVDDSVTVRKVTSRFLERRA
jgi:chemosensory pili system protein ChpA (sensor histidine kinase/response regulator)